MSFSKFKFDKKIILSFWIILIALIIAAPTLLPVFRLNLLGRYLSLSIVALGVDLIWGYTGLLSLGQGIFFALGGYCAAMYLQITSSSEFPAACTVLPFDTLPRSAFFALCWLPLNGRFDAGDWVQATYKPEN